MLWYRKCDTKKSITFYIATFIFLYGPLYNEIEQLIKK